MRSSREKERRKSKGRSHHLPTTSNFYWHLLLSPPSIIFKFNGNESEIQLEWWKVECFLFGDTSQGKVRKKNEHLVKY